MSRIRCLEIMLIQLPIFDSPSARPVGSLPMSCGHFMAGNCAHEDVNTASGQVIRKRVNTYKGLNLAGIMMEYGAHPHTPWVGRRQHNAFPALVSQKVPRPRMRGVWTIAPKRKGAKLMKLLHVHGTLMAISALIVRFGHPC